MKVIFSNEIIASDFFNEITNNYTEDILDPYHGRIEMYRYVPKAYSGIYDCGVYKNL